VAEISPARRAAFRILLTMERGHTHADDLLRGEAVNALSPADRNLTTALVLGVLRWQIVLDRQLKGLLKKPGAKLEPEALIALRLGAFQLLFLDRIPSHAAIGESVELVKQAGHRFASGMVNAVLRKMARPQDDTGSTDAANPNMRADSAAAEAYPTWMMQRWAARYGEEAACAICRHGQAQAALSLRMEDAEVEAELVQSGIELAPGRLLAASRVVISGDVTATAAFREGRVRIQDEGSQLIAEIAAVAGAGLTENILDACAAPGGKTLLLAERNPRAHIVACESSPQRFAQMRDRLAARAGQIDFRLADAAALEERGAFDLALVDVPCSGTGTLGRNPEIRHRLRADDLPPHAERQQAILRAAIRATRPGGRVVYSTCSLEPEENQQVVTAILAESSSARQIPLEGAIELLNNDGILAPHAAEPLRACLTPDGALRLLPGALHTDGFFLALIDKIA
jgi:16S rRNA (cytosine967-C5)-methyltransferase